MGKKGDDVSEGGRRERRLGGSRSGRGKGGWWGSGRGRGGGVFWGLNGLF